MKFVDEAVVSVKAGNGGNGCLSFRREKFIAKGGPNGGNGGAGGSVFLVASDRTNTLVDFKVLREYRAETGLHGKGQDRTGRSGDDLKIIIPVGTVIYDKDTGELIGDLASLDQEIMVAEGGHGGLGNAHFKSSINRSPRRTTLGTKGESRNLGLELKLIADVGLLGMPNAGKSTLIRAMSAAKPKVADYPFTTLYPNLGVVSVGLDQSFVIADIPGLIKGAADGLGLGIKFLKHLQRTQLLLHIVDIMPFDDSMNPVEVFHELEHELEKFSDELMAKPRWLIINKIDLLEKKEIITYCKKFVNNLNWSGPVFEISAISGQGTKDLSKAISQELIKMRKVKEAL